MEKFNKENIAVAKIKKDPKYFFNYSKRFQKTNFTPSILIDKNNQIVSDPKFIADTLQKQFQSVFSQPTKENVILPNLKTPIIKYPLSPQLELTKTDFTSAIDKIKTSSACPKGDIPSSVFKIYKDSLSVPLKKFWAKSFELSYIPSYYKTQLITPIHKKGSKNNPENYRPISITSHTIKIFERILRKKLAIYLETNEIINDNQHGFRTNRSCSTQLISHTYNAFESLVRGSEVDCIYLDFSKAFDKVDHQILLQKLKKIYIPTTFINWIESFLKGRTQIVSVEGRTSFAAPVLSGVPQGCVLAPLLFNIYTNDLSDGIENCRILKFADDTKLIADINSSIDASQLQSNLTKIFTWSKHNNMILNPTSSNYYS